jgi:hypothetical protein
MERLHHAIDSVSAVCEPHAIRLMAGHDIFSGILYCEDTGEMPAGLA